jgi:hypothetical protein
VLAVLSPAYVHSDYARDEWTAALVRDRGQADRLLPVRVARGELPPLLATRVYIDLVDLEEQLAVERLVAGVPAGRVRPAGKRPFPGAGRPEAGGAARFPGRPPAIFNVSVPENVSFTQTLLTSSGGAALGGEFAGLLGGVDRLAALGTVVENGGYSGERRRLAAMLSPRSVGGVRAAGRGPRGSAMERASPAQQAVTPRPADRQRDASARRPRAAAPPQPGLRRLQRTLGNRGLQRFLASGAIQAKLAGGRAGDEYEREADRVAGEVTRLSEPGAAAVEGPPLARRAGEPGDGEPERQLDRLHGHGQPLPSGERAFMESWFGHSFEKVRVHTGPAADETASVLGARAFTLGHEVVFAAGSYRSGTAAGRRLLAHELAHVVQQGAARGSGGPAPVATRLQAPRLVQRWEGLEHRKVGNRAQGKFPFRGTVPTDMTALRATPHRDPDAPHSNTRADLLSGASVLVLGTERGWMQVLVESGKARDKQGAIVPADDLTGYISHELITRSGDVFDAELPVGGGLVLGYGDLVAFGGDHFKDFAQLTGEASSAAGRGRLTKLRDLTANEATLHPAYEEASTISAEYAERYRNLALENVSHFSGGGTALTTWQKLHRGAVLDALEAGKRGDSQALAGAYAVNAFADHYLTDSFSAGHIRVPREQVTVQYRKLAGEVFQHLIDHISARLGGRIFELLGRDYPRVRRHGTAEDRQEAVARVRTRMMGRIAAAGGMAMIEEQFGLYVGGAISKILHDRENTLGLAVVSRRHPEGWMAYGDAKLETPDNETNLRYMTEAVQASKQDLLAAFRIGVDVLTRHGKTPSQPAVDAAMARLTKEVGPPFAALELVPSPAPGAPPLPSWEWGKLDKFVKSELVKLIARYLTTNVQTQLLEEFPEHEEVEVTGPDVEARPRDAAREILNEALADPITFLEQAFGRRAGP